MAIADLGALGEFVGSIAVLITLVYLALQVKHTKALLERSEKISMSQVFQARIDSRRELEKLVIDDTIAPIIVRSRDLTKATELSDLERLRMRQLHSLWMDWWDNNLYQESLGLVDADDIELDVELFEPLLRAWQSSGLTVNQESSSGTKRGERNKLRSSSLPMRYEKPPTIRRRSGV